METEGGDSKCLLHFCYRTEGDRSIHRRTIRRRCGRGFAFVAMDGRFRVAFSGTGTEQRWWTENLPSALVLLFGFFDRNDVRVDRRGGLVLHHLSWRRNVDLSPHKSSAEDLARVLRDTHETLQEFAPRMKTHRLLLHAAAETCTSRRLRRELHHFAERSATTKGSARSAVPLLARRATCWRRVRESQTCSRSTLTFANRSTITAANWTEPSAIRYCSCSWQLSPSPYWRSSYWIDRILTFDPSDARSTVLAPSSAQAQRLSFDQVIGLTNQSIPVLILTTLVVGIVIRVVGGELTWHRTVGHFPWIGSLRRMHSSAELLQNVSLLLRAGLPMAEAFELAGRASESSINRFLGDGIAQDIKGGKTLVEALATRSWFPNWMVDYVFRAEGHQPLEKVCRDTAWLLLVQSSSKCANLVRTLPPILFCCLLILLQYSYVSLIAKMVNHLRALTGF